MLAESSFSQLPAQNVMTESKTNEIQNQPEIPKQVSNVEVKNNLLSVELIDAEFGSVMNSIAQKSGFKVEISSDVSNRKLTTKFNDIDLERGIARLLTLIREKNYLIHYDTKGMLSKIEIYGGTSAASAVSKPRTSIRRRPAYIPSPRRPSFPRSRPSRQAVQPPSQTQAPQNIIDDEEEGIGEIPYIPPQEKPVFIPPKRR